MVVWGFGLLPSRPSENSTPTLWVGVLFSVGCDGSKPKPHTTPGPGSLQGSCQGHSRVTPGVMSGSLQGHIRVVSGSFQGHSRGHVRVTPGSLQGHIKGHFKVISWLSAGACSSRAQVPHQNGQHPVLVRLTTGRPALPLAFAVYGRAASLGD